MSILVKAVVAPQPRTPESGKIAIIFAAILVIMAVAQLFTFEEFLVHIKLLQLPFGEAISQALGPIIVVSEVFAVPFLLRMSLSPAFRYLSMFLGLLASALWLCIATWIVTSHVAVLTVGFLGTVVDLTPGYWAIFMSFALVILAIWSSWGLWPGKR